MFDYNLSVNLSICLKMYVKISQKIPNMDARISPDGISPDTSIVNLFITKPRDKKPIIRINVTTTEVQLDKNTFNISIIGTIDETESRDVPFADIDVNQIIKKYKHLDPLIKEGISHSVGLCPKPTRIASRSLAVRYRMLDRMYEEDENYDYDIDENEIAELVVPYIMSMQDIYSRLRSIP